MRYYNGPISAEALIAAIPILVLLFFAYLWKKVRDQRDKARAEASKSLEVIEVLALAPEGDVTLELLVVFSSISLLVGSVFVLARFDLDQSTTTAAIAAMLPLWLGGTAGALLALQRSRSAPLRLDERQLRFELPGEAPLVVALSEPFELRSEVGWLAKQPNQRIWTITLTDGRSVTFSHAVEVDRRPPACDRKQYGRSWRLPDEGESIFERLSQIAKERAAR